MADHTSSTPTPNEAIHVCYHVDSVKYNSFNAVVQCHRCGMVFLPQARWALDSHESIQAPLGASVFPAWLPQHIIQALEQTSSHHGYRWCNICERTIKLAIEASIHHAGRNKQ